MKLEYVRLGVIGIGYWGPNLVRNLSEMRSVDVVAVADVKDSRRAWFQERYPIQYVTDDYHEFFDMNLHAAIIATPPATHYRIASECLEHGLHVFVEKPLTTNLSDARALVRLADERNQQLMVGHTFEYNPAVQEIRRIIDSGELGDIFYIDSVRTNLGLFQLNTDAMWDLAPHDISIVNYLLGTEPIRVMAHGASYIMRTYGVHDLVYIHIEYPNDVLANVRVSWLDPNKVRRTTVIGNKKMLVYDDVETTEKIRVFDKGVEAPPYTESYGEFQCSYRYGDITIPHINWAEPLRIECQHFIDCVMNDNSPTSDGRSGLRVVQVLEAAEESMRVGHAVDITALQAAS